MPSLAAPPEAIRLQGTVLQIAGQPPAEEVYSFEVDIFDAAVGGNSLLPAPIPVSARLRAGAYSILLTPQTAGDLSTALSTPPTFFEVRVVDGPGVTMSELVHPRQEIASVPYALNVPASEPSSTVTIDRAEKTDLQPFSGTTWTTVLADGNASNLSVAMSVPAVGYKITVTAKAVLKQYINTAGTGTYTHLRLVEDCGAGAASVDEALNWTQDGGVFFVPSLRYVNESPPVGVTCTYTLEAATYLNSAEVNGTYPAGPAQRHTTWIEAQMELAD